VATIEKPTTYQADGHAKTAPPEAYYATEPRGAGWVLFAAIMLGFAGTLALIDGIVALSRSSFYVAGAHFVFSDLRTWAWITLILGAVAILAAFGVVAGSAWARWFGIVVAAVNAIGQLAWIQSYPMWSLCIFAVDILVIYALAVYGGLRATTE
jgi:hypothetical protein